MNLNKSLCLFIKAFWKKWENSGQKSASLTLYYQHSCAVCSNWDVGTPFVTLR